MIWPRREHSRIESRAFLDVATLPLPAGGREGLEGFLVFWDHRSVKLTMSDCCSRKQRRLSPVSRRGQMPLTVLPPMRHSIVIPATSMNQTRSNRRSD